ncbi:MAG: hypothetical protein JF587_20220 [Catenulisporales bacterium]|nr:hypothetical protein [Catenulisporales bacterium]
MSGSNSPGPGVHSFDAELGEGAGEGGDEDGDEEEGEGDEADPDDEPDDELDDDDTGPPGFTVGLAVAELCEGDTPVDRTGVAAPLDWSQPASTSSPTAATPPRRIVRLVLMHTSIHQAPEPWGKPARRLTRRRGGSTVQNMRLPGQPAEAIAAGSIEVVDPTAPLPIVPGSGSPARVPALVERG